MTTMYNPGYGGDQPGYTGGYNPLEEERRRRREQQQGQQQQNPYQQQNEQAQRGLSQAPPTSNQPVQTGRFQQGTMPQQTFAQLQQQGQARPAPPAQAQPMQPPAPTGDAMPFNGPMVNARYGTAGTNQDLLLGAAANTGGVPMAGPPQFTGDVGDYLRQLMNAQGPQVTRPDLPNNAAVLEQLRQLGQITLPNAPTYQVDPRLMQQAQQLTSGGQLAGGPLAGAASAMTASGVSAAGVDPVAAMQGGQAANVSDLQRNAQGMEAPPGLEFRPDGSGNTAPLGSYANRDRSVAELSASAMGLQPNSQERQNFINIGLDRLSQQFTAPDGRVDLASAQQAGFQVTPSAWGDPNVVTVHVGDTREVGRAFNRDGTPWTGGPGRPAPAGGAAGVSAAGVDPMAAMAGGGAPTAGAGGAGGPAGGGARTGSMEALLQEAYANPSAFDNAAVQELYGRLGQDIDDRFTQQQTALREEMAARGLSDSSILGGRLADLNVGQRQARTELANQLGIQRAQDYAQARNAAIGLGMQQQQNALQAELGRGNLDVNRQQAATSAELGRGNLALQGELGRGNLALSNQRLGLESQGQRFGQQMQGLQFQNQLGQQGFQNQLASAQFGLQRAGQQFNQGLQGAQFQNQIGQQGFQNQMSLADLQRALGTDAFGQRMTTLNALTGYGQQAFNNDMSRADFNRQLQNDQWRRYLDSIALGG